MKGPSLPVLAATAAAFVSALFSSLSEADSSQPWVTVETLTVIPGKTGFTRLGPEATGVTFENVLDEAAAAANRTLTSGSGVAIGDYDGDGKPDLYFCSLDGHNKLYRNLGGFKFQDVTEQAGVECLGYVCRGAVFADIDGDGRPDLLVGTSGDGVLVFLNDGKGHFKNFTKESGLASRHASFTFAVADVNGDGALDVYVCNNRRDDYRDQPELHLLQRDGKLVVPERLADQFVIDSNGAVLEYGEPSQLYLNDGKGHFTPVSWTDGSFLDEAGKPLAGPPLDWGLTATFRDINGDGAPDLYVCNDYWSPDRIWINDGKGRFRAMPWQNVRKTSASSMGVDFADVNRDGRLDFFVVDMLSRDHQRRKMQMGAMKPTPTSIGEIETRPQVMRNTLQINRGDGTFAELAYFAGLAASEWSWQPLFIDVDLDGYEDLVISAGHYRDVQDADASNKIKELQSRHELVPASAFGNRIAPPDEQTGFTRELLEMAKLRPRLESPLVAFRNRGGTSFEDVGAAWGTGDLGVHHGIAYADLDGDGDLDLVVNNLGSPAGIYRNDGSAPRVAVRLRGLPGNPDGIGARVTLLGGAVPRQSQEVVAGGRYMSGCDAQVCFAAGQAKEGMTIEITWRSGRVSTVPAVKFNRRYVVDERGSREAPVEKPVKPEPLFADVSDRLGHVHHENAFDDFKRQLLLPNRLSQLGPGVAWADLNGDGRDCLLVGSGKDGRLGAFASDGAGGFVPVPAAASFPAAVRDQTQLLTWSPSAGETSLLFGSSNFEDGRLDGESAGRIDFKHGVATGVPGLPQTDASSTGPMCMADVDGDGQLDLFVGGRTIPGRYPEAATSHLYLRKGDQWVEDRKNAPLFAGLGLVSGAVFSDLDGDGAPDLILALEWGPIKVFMNDGHGKFTDATERLGLASELGWWNGVAVGDFDGDGRMDIVATNWGRNSKYERHYDATHPLAVHWGEFNGDGVVQIVESHFDHGMNRAVPERGLSCSSTAMPFIKRITPTYQAFGGAGIAEIYGEKLRDAQSLEATTLESKIFLNRGDHFEAVPLPAEAQWSPAFGVNVADFDGDGNEDLFLAQNFFAAQIETPRIDAGRGLLLRGDGKGGFTPASGPESGIAAYGDCRGSAVGDFDGDGRLDIAVAQNGAPTKLFHNLRGRPGLRVRLAGPEGNATAVGAQLRLAFSADRRGPLHEIHAGSGYWSQDSQTQILAAPEPPENLWVRWPGGKETSSPLPTGAREVLVHPDGVIDVPAVAAGR